MACPLSTLSSKKQLVDRIYKKVVSFACSMGTSAMNRLCEQNNQELPEVTCTSLYQNIVILVPDSLHWTKKCEKKRSRERNQACTYLPATGNVHPSRKNTT